MVGTKVGQQEPDGQLRLTSRGGLRVGAGRVEKCLDSSMNLAWTDSCITSAPSP